MKERGKGQGKDLAKKSISLIANYSQPPQGLSLIGAALLCVTLQPALAAESAVTLYKQCQGKITTAEQRDCYPAVIRQSEIELAVAEKKARADLVELETISPGSRDAHPVLTFDKAKRAYRAFRDAERDRVLGSFGSGSGGGLAASEMIIEMNIARASLLNHHE